MAAPGQQQHICARLVQRTLRLFKVLLLAMLAQWVAHTTMQTFIGSAIPRSTHSRDQVRRAAEPLELNTFEDIEQEIDFGELEEVPVYDVEVPSMGRRGAMLAASTAAAGLASMALPQLPASAEQFQTRAAEWEQYDLNTGQTLYDIDFDPKDPSHGFVVGARGLFYETKDYGRRWVSRSFTNLNSGEEAKYRFQAVAVNGDDVWILGKPPLILHSKDGGVKWSKVPLSKKLPGEPKVITAFGDGVAEMATNSGAVYRTVNDGRTWKSRIRETVDATLNRVTSSGVEGASYFSGTVKSIRRNPDGGYLAVAQRGNFFLTLAPGDDSWVPHNRVTARRIQAMGYRITTDATQKDTDGVWMTLNGGYLSTTTTNEYQDMQKQTKDIFAFSEIRTGGIGIIDIAYRTPAEAWAVGGSGVIYYSSDGGRTFNYDKSGNELPCNLYNVKFFDGGKVGYMIGSAGILLRKVFPGGANAV
mmetsp:Transcript_15655/g.28459  ORF Transcript_15655/g.28459 Transcript_15655/m.28459 type:complete len:473 (+) Transcript_15655:94-1512(+)